MEKDKGGLGLLVRGWKWPASRRPISLLRTDLLLSPASFLHFVTAQKDAVCHMCESNSGPQSTTNLPFKASLKCLTIKQSETDFSVRQFFSFSSRRCSRGDSAENSGVMAAAAAPSNGVATTMSSETGGVENGGGIDRHTVIRQPNTRLGRDFDIVAHIPVILLFLETQMTSAL